MPSSVPESVRRIRRRNLGRILSTVASQGEVRQNDLPTLTELATGAVSTMVNELLDAGLLESRALLDNRRGRPARLLRVADTGLHLIAISVIRTQVEARGFTLAGRQIWARIVPIEPGQGGMRFVGATIGSIVSSALAAESARGDQIEVSISIPGRHTHGHVDAIEMEWEHEPDRLLLDPLKELTNVGVFIGNDGSLAALAESIRGRGRGTQSIATVHLDHGLGGSAIVNGTFVNGYGRVAGWGHIPIDPNGPLCKCGLYGCAELYFSLLAIADDLGEHDLLAAAPTAAYVTSLEARARDEDPDVLRTLTVARERFQDLGDILASIFDPEIIVVTGRGAPLTPWIMPTSVGASATPLAQGELGADAVIQGAMLAAQRARFDNPS